MSEAALEIGRLGARGDGIADRPGEAVCVPFALPGETISAEDREILIERPTHVDFKCRYPDNAEKGEYRCPHIEPSNDRLKSL